MKAGEKGCERAERGPRERSGRERRDIEIVVGEAEAEETTDLGGRRGERR